MKKITQLLLICAIAVVMAVSVSAATVTLDLDAYDADANQYVLTVDYQAEGGNLNIVTVRFDFNSEKLILADGYFAAIDDVTTAKGSPLYFPKVTVTEGRDTVDYRYELPNADTGAQWTVDGNTVSAYITAYSTKGSNFDAENGFEVFEVSFLLADGVTPESLTADDFALTSVYVADAGLGEEYGYNIEGKAALTVVNNVAPEAEETEIPENAAVMNDAQELYYKAAERKGVVYTASFASALKESVTEYGVLVFVESAKNKAAAAAGGYSIENVDMTLVDAGLAHKSVSYNETTNVYYNEAEGTVNYKVAVIGVPLYQDAVATTVVVRPYYVVGGATVYGAPVEADLYEVAKATADNEAVYGALTEDVQEFVDTVVDLIDNKEVTIDMSEVLL